MSGHAEHGARLLGGRLAGFGAMGGGDLSSLVLVRLEDGREAVVKTGPDPRAEAAMLACIRASGAPTPGVLGVDAGVLVLEPVAHDGGRGAGADLGRVVARLHACTGERYGWETDYAFGPVAIGNAWSEDWPAFWGGRRLACHCAGVAAPLARRIERLAAALPERLPPHPRPALLHGDLWGGNVLVRDGRVAGLIDPACYHGHAEVDLAMLTLFGDPGPDFHAAYAEAAPGTPEPGAAERRPIYRLWPALVHLRLFGDGYRGMVERLLDDAGA